MLSNDFGYELDFLNKEIILTTRFAREASQLESDNYKIIVNLRRDFPDYTFAIKTALGIKRKREA